MSLDAKVIGNSRLTSSRCRRLTTSRRASCNSKGSFFLQPLLAMDGQCTRGRPTVPLQRGEKGRFSRPPLVVLSGWFFAVSRSRALRPMMLFVRNDTRATCPDIPVARNPARDGTDWRYKLLEPSHGSVSSGREWTASYLLRTTESLPMGICAFPVHLANPSRDCEPNKT